MSSAVLMVVSVDACGESVVCSGLLGVLSVTDGACSCDVAVA